MGVGVRTRAFARRFGIVASVAVLTMGLASVVSSAVAAADDASVSGTVTNAAAQTLAGMNVYVFGLSDGYSATVLTGSDGSYEITGLPAESYEVIFSDPCRLSCSART